MSCLSVKLTPVINGAPGGPAYRRKQLLLIDAHCTSIHLTWHSDGTVAHFIRGRCWVRVNARDPHSVDDRIANYSQHGVLAWLAPWYAVFHCCCQTISTSQSHWHVVCPRNVNCVVSAKILCGPEVPNNIGSLVSNPAITFGGLARAQGWLARKKAYRIWKYKRPAVRLSI